MAQPMGGNGGKGNWKDLALAIMTTALITSATQWFAFGKDTVRKEEVQGLQSAVTELSKTVGQLTTTVAVLSDRISRQDAVKK